MQKKGLTWASGSHNSPNGTADGSLHCDHKALRATEQQGELRLVAVTPMRCLSERGGTLEPPPMRGEMGGVPGAHTPGTSGARTGRRVSGAGR